MLTTPKMTRNSWQLGLLVSLEKSGSPSMAMPLMSLPFCSCVKLFSVSTAWAAAQTTTALRPPLH